MGIKDIIDRLTSYNLFNYLFPGFIFVIILKESTCYIESDKFTVISVVVIYFLGLILSRIGSLIIEELLLKLRLIDPIDTKTYFEKAKDDTRLEIIFEAMNMYRTLASMSLILSLLTFAELFSDMFQFFKSLMYCYLEFLLFMLFTFAFCKQRKKVSACLSPKGPVKQTEKNDIKAVSLKLINALKKFLEK